MSFWISKDRTAWYSKDVCSLEITIFCCTSIEIVSLIFVLCFSRNGHNFSIRSSKLFFEILKLSTRSDSRNSPFTNFSHYPNILPLLTWLGDTVSFSVLATDVSFYERRGVWSSNISLFPFNWFFYICKIIGNWNAFNR